MHTHNVQVALLICLQGRRIAVEGNKFDLVSAEAQMIKGVSGDKSGAAGHCAVNCYLSVFFQLD
ncbi:hypothetical protein D3C73_1578040 [compost metagenome]